MSDQENQDQDEPERLDRPNQQVVQGGPEQPEPQSEPEPEPAEDPNAPT